MSGASGPPAKRPTVGCTPVTPELLPAKKKRKKKQTPKKQKKPRSRRARAASKAAWIPACNNLQDLMTAFDFEVGSALKNMFPYFHKFFSMRRAEKLARNYSLCGIPLHYFQRRFVRLWWPPGSLDTLAELGRLWKFSGRFDLLRILSPAITPAGAYQGTRRRLLGSKIQAHIASFFTSPKPRKQGLPGLTVTKAGQMQVEIPSNMDTKLPFFRQVVRTRIQRIEATNTKEAIRAVLGLPLVDTSAPHSLVLSMSVGHESDQEFQAFVTVPSNACISDISTFALDDHVYPEDNYHDLEDSYAGWKSLWLKANEYSGYSLKTETRPASAPSWQSVQIQQRRREHTFTEDQTKRITVRLSRLYDRIYHYSGFGEAPAAAPIKVFGSRARLMDSLKERSLLGCIGDGDAKTYTENSWGGDISTPCAMVDVLPTLRETRLPSAVPLEDYMASGPDVIAELDFSRRSESVFVTVVAVAPRLPDHKYPVYSSAGLKARISSVWGEMLDC